MLRRIVVAVAITLASVVGVLSLTAGPANAMVYRCVGVVGGLLCQDLDTGRIWYIAD